MKNMNITTSHRDIGLQGEEEAVRFLVENGYRILARNWQFRHLEVDIIAEDEEFIVFCEVKTRKDKRYGEPETFVTREKQKNIIAAAGAYLRYFHISKEVRFDILAVIRTPESVEINHLKDAYKPRW